jgi:hypothetical protein
MSMAAHFGLVVCVAFNLCGCGSPSASSGAADSGYEVSFDRPSSVGDKRTETGVIEITLNESISANGRMVQASDNSARVRFSTESEVIAVSADGEPTEILHIVRSITGTLDGETIRPIPVGTEIRASSRTGSDQISGIPQGTDPVVQTALEAVFSVGEPDNPSDQEVFAPPGRVQIGERWNIDLELFRNNFDSGGLSLSGADLSGYAQLLDVRVVDGVECLLVHAQVDAKNVKVTDLPPGARMDTSTLFFAISGSMPIDTTLSDRDTTVSLTFDLKARGDNGVEATRLLTMSIEVAYAYPGE